MNKSAQAGWEQVLKALPKILPAAAAGGAMGYYAMPHLSGYADVEPARRISSVLWGSLAAVPGLSSALKNPSVLAGMSRGISPKALAGIAGGLTAAELVPIGVATMTRQQQAMKDMANAATESSIPAGIRSALGTGTAKGVGIGAAGAGIGGLISGLIRKRNEEEMAQHTPRSKMIAADVLKYLLPAMLAGGVTGSVIPGGNQ